MSKIPSYEKTMSVGVGSDSLDVEVLACVVLDSR